MYKFQPILKSTIWGGGKIVPYKHIASDQKQVGESWELSGVKGNESVVAGGPEAGTTLPGLIARHGAALLGKADAAPLRAGVPAADQVHRRTAGSLDPGAPERRTGMGAPQIERQDRDVVRRGRRQRRTPALGIAKQVTPAQVRSQRRGQHHHRPARRI